MKKEIYEKITILWPPDVKGWLIGNDPDVGKNWGQEEKGAKEADGWMASATQQIWVNKLWEIVKDREACHSAVHGVAKSWTQLRDWTAATCADDNVTQKKSYGSH